MPFSMEEVVLDLGTQQAPRPRLRRDRNIMRGAKILRDQILNAVDDDNFQSHHPTFSGEIMWSETPEAMVSSSSSSEEDYEKRRNKKLPKPIRGDTNKSIKVKVPLTVSPSPTTTTMKMKTSSNLRAKQLTPPPPPPHASLPPRLRRNHETDSAQMKCNTAYTLNYVDADDSSHVYAGDTDRNRKAFRTPVKPVPQPTSFQRDASDLSYGIVGWHLCADPFVSPISTEPEPQLSPIDDIPSPLSAEYRTLLDDPAFQHALNAGQCWQSLVGQLVRFPSQWWNGARGPPMGCLGREQTREWRFFGRYQMKSNEVMNKLIPNRAAPGVLLIHIIVQDMMTVSPVQDIVIGAFHPNARRIRRSVEPAPVEEPNRDIWMAVRKRGDCVSVTDNLLNRGRLAAAKSPLGMHHISNQHIRAVFGDSPPLDTIFLSEGILYERLSLFMNGIANLSPAEAILQAFVF